MAGEVGGHRGEEVTGQSGQNGVGLKNTDF